MRSLGKTIGSISTDIPKIHIAKVREHDYQSLHDTYEALREK